MSLSLAGADTAAADVVRAPAATAFRDSVGVNTHFDFTGHAYGLSDISALRSALQTIGITHIRDGACFDTDANCAVVRSRIAQLSDADSSGPGHKVDAIIISAPLVDAKSPTNSKVLMSRDERDASILRSLTAIRDSPMRPNVEGIEMVNEPDLKAKTVPGWAAQTVADAQTFRRILAEPEFADLQGIPLIAPSLGREENVAALIAAGWTQDLADTSNVHAYPSTTSTPEQTGIATMCPAKGTITVIACAQQLAPSAQPLATESGYTTAGTFLTSDWVNKDTQATYTLRMLLNNFNAGIPRTYLYEMIDLTTDQYSRNEGYGLYAAQGVTGGVAIGQIKPVGSAVANLNAEIGDLDAAAVPGDIDLSVTDPSTGAALGNDVIDKTIVRRADGSYALALWQPALSETTAYLQTPNSLTVPVRNVRVRLDGSHGAWSATSYHPVDGALPVQHWSDTASLDLSISDDVTLIDLQPPTELRGPTLPEPTATATPTPTPTPEPTPSNPVTPTPTPTPSPGSGQPPVATPTPTPTASPTPAPAPAPAPTEPPAATPAAQTPLRSSAPTPATPMPTATPKPASARASARAKARRAYVTCLRRQLASAKRAHPRAHLTHSTAKMRAKCSRLLSL